MAAKIETPGAMTSGLRMFSVRLEGPLDEKEATIGAGRYLGTSIVGRIVAVGFL
jgi:hypothetical protein